METKNNRRNFLKQTTIAISAMAFPFPLSALAKSKHKLSFSTLGCPKWSFQEIVKFAASNNYQGIEIRTIEGELDLPNCRDFNKENIKNSILLVKDNGLEIVGLGASTKLHFTEGSLRKANLDEAKRFIDLANQLGSGFVRVFPDKLPKDNSRFQIIDLITQGLQELADYAKGTSVNILLESHGDLVYTDDLLFVMRNADKSNIGMIWDILNMWSVTKESPKEVFSKLKQYIKHVHVKDAVFNNGKQEYVLLGKGVAPNKEALSLLSNNNFKGFYSFEWEKMWHPELEEPEIAIAHYSKEIQKYF